MLNEVFQQAWDVAWNRRDTWWVALWLGLFGVAVLAATASLLARSGLSVQGPGFGLVAPPPYGTLGPPTGVAGASPLPGLSDPVLLSLGGVLMISGGLIAPFVMAGAYGVVARAMRSRDSLPASAFWQEGWRNWGRGYGLILLGLVIGVIAVLAAVTLFAVLHLLGGFGVVLAVLGSVAAFVGAGLWMYWSVSHLFLGQWTWSRSLSQGLLDTWTYKWSSLGVMVVLILGGSLLNLVTTPLEQMWLPLGLVVGIAVSGWIGLFSATVTLGFHAYGERHGGAA
ncbi:MAG: hypothetical protein M0Z54_02155 [Thermaerobacter sp.]|nr:hypothetical protein [Thermaerobacter sp.]